MTVKAEMIEDLFAQLVDARGAANLIRRQDDATVAAGARMSSQERSALMETIDSLEIVIKHLDAAFPE